MVTRFIIIVNFAAVFQKVIMDKKHDIEFASQEEIKQFQEGKLHDALLYLQQHSRYYQRMFERYGIKVEKIRTIED